MSAGRIASAGHHSRAFTNYKKLRGGLEVETSLLLNEEFTR